MKEIYDAIYQNIMYNNVFVTLICCILLDIHPITLLMNICIFYIYIHPITLLMNICICHIYNHPITLLMNICIFHIYIHPITVVGQLVVESLDVVASHVQAGGALH